MLHMKRVDQPFTWERDHITGDYIRFGEWYYWDDEDGLVVSLRTYRQFKRQKELDTFDYTRLNQAASQREYEEILKESTRIHNMETLLDRRIEGDS